MYRFDRIAEQADGVIADRAGKGFSKSDRGSPVVSWRLGGRKSAFFKGAEPRDVWTV